MKNRYLLFTLLGAAAVLVGCEKQETPPINVSEPTARQLDKVRTDAKAAVQDMTDYAYAQKSEFLTKMQAQLDENKREVDQLVAKIENANDAVKAEAKPK